jgi:hypothetical protein
MCGHNHRLRKIRHVYGIYVDRSHMSLIRCAHTAGRYIFSDFSDDCLYKAMTAFTRHACII